MSLSQFLSKLTSNGVQVTVTDLTSGDEIVSLKSTGYTALDDTVEGREVVQWSIISATHVKVVLGNAVNG